MLDRHVAADHRPHEAARRLLASWCGAYERSVLEDGDVVDERQDLLEEVRYVDDRDAVACQVADDLEQPLVIPGGERRGRLVHDHESRVPHQGAHDFHFLLRGDGERVHASIRVEAEARSVVELGEPLSGRP